MLNKEKERQKDETKHKPKEESKGPIAKFIVNSEHQYQNKRKEQFVTTDEYHNRQTDSSKSSKTLVQDKLY